MTHPRVTQLCVAVSALILASAVGARLSPRAFATGWGAWWNQQAAAHKTPLRITSLGCKADGEAVYLCIADLTNKKTGLEACEDIAIGTTGQVLEAQKITCLPTA